MKHESYFKNKIITYNYKKRGGSMSLINGSDEYYDLKKHAEKLYRAASNARSTSERRNIAQKANKFADRMEEEYGVRDSEVKYIIKEFYLRRLD